MPWRTWHLPSLLLLLPVVGADNQSACLGERVVAYADGMSVPQCRMVACRTRGLFDELQTGRVSQLSDTVVVDRSVHCTVLFLDRVSRGGRRFVSTRFSGWVLVCVAPQCARRRRGKLRRDSDCQDVRTKGCAPCTRSWESAIVCTLSILR